MVHGIGAPDRLAVVESPFNDQQIKTFLRRAKKHVGGEQAWEIVVDAACLQAFARQMGASFTSEELKLARQAMRREAGIDDE